MSKLIDMWGYSANPDGQPGARYHILDRVKDDQYLVQYYSPRDGSELLCQVVGVEAFTEPGTYLYPSREALANALDTAANGGRPSMPVHLVTNDALQYRLLEYYNAAAGRYGNPSNDILVALYEACLAGWISAGGWSASDVDFRRGEPLVHPEHGLVFFLGFHEGMAWVTTSGRYETVKASDLARPEDAPPPDNVIWLYPPTDTRH